MDNLKEKISELIWKELNDEAFFLPTEKLNKASDKILSLILNQITKEVEGIMPAKRAKELADNLELYHGIRECKICGTNPENQRKIILDLLSTLASATQDKGKGK